MKKRMSPIYDIFNLINFISTIKSSAVSKKIPVYSHLIYDILKNVQQTIFKPNILILERLNILQNNYQKHDALTQFFISGFIDFSIYIDAPEHLLKKPIDF